MRHWQDAVAADLDGLVLAVPAPLQPEILSAAVDAGRPVFAEKPLAMNTAAAADIARRAAAQGVLVVVDHIHLFSPAFRALVERAAELAPVVRIDAEAGRFGPFRDGVPVLWDWGPTT